MKTEKTELASISHSCRVNSTLQPSFGLDLIGRTITPPDLLSFPLECVRKKKSVLTKQPDLNK